MGDQSAMKLRGLDPKGDSTGPSLQHWENRVSCEIRSEAGHWTSLFDIRGPREPEGANFDVNSISGMATRSTAASENQPMTDMEKMVARKRLDTSTNIQDQKTKAVGILLRNLDQSFLEKLQSSTGYAAIQENPVQLLILIRTRYHVANPGLDVDEQSNQVQEQYKNISMAANESIYAYSVRMQELNKCIKTLTPDKADTDTALATHFIKRLPERYHMLKFNMVNKLISKPATIQAAIDLAVAHVPLDEVRGTSEAPKMHQAKTNWKQKQRQKGGQSDNVPKNKDGTVRKITDASREKFKNGCALCESSSHSFRECERHKKYVEALRAERTKNAGGGKKYGDSRSESGGKMNKFVADTDITVGDMHDVEVFDEECADSQKVDILCQSVRTQGAEGNFLVQFDPGCNRSGFSNSRLVTDIKETKDVISMNTADRTNKPMNCKQVGNSDFGTVYVDTRFNGNLLSPNWMKTQHGYDWEYHPQRDMFVVTTPSKVFQFSRRQDLLYYCDPRYDFHHVGQMRFATVQEKRAKYDKDQLAGADASDDLWAKLGFPARAKLEEMLRRNAIKNAPCTAEHSVIARDCHGPDEAALKGKSTAKKQRPIKEHYQPRPEHLQDQTLHLDLMYVENCRQPLLISRAHPSLYRQVDACGSKSSANIEPMVLKHIGALSSRGYTVRKLRMDGEAGMDTLQSKLAAQLGIHIERTARGEKVVEVERDIRTLKGRFRTLRHHLPFMMPTFLVTAAFKYLVDRWNMEPSAHGGYYQSPREEVLGRGVDFKTDLALEFGQYVHAFLTSTHSGVLTTRTTTAIALHPTGAQSGSWTFMNLTTRGTFQALRWQVVDMPTDVITKLNTYGTQWKLAANPAIGLSNPLQLVADFDDDYVQPAGLPAATRHRPPQPLDNTAEMSSEPTSLSGGMASPQQPTAPAAETGPAAETEPPADTEPATASDTEPGTANATEPATATASETDPALSADTTLLPTTDSGGIAFNTDQDFIESAIANIRHNLRTAETDNTKDGRIMQMSTRTALQTHGDDALKAFVNEMWQMHQLNVFEPADVRRLTVAQRKRVLPSKTFFKEKWNPDGSFEKLKARLVAGGHRQDAELFADNSHSPTVATCSVFTLMAIAAAEQRSVCAIDFPGAFLNASMPDDDPDKAVHVRLGKYETAVLVNIDPAYELNVDSATGTTVVRLTKAMYGCIQSAKLWYDKIRATLEHLGFTANAYDDCVFTRKNAKDKIMACIHVDDMFISGNNNAAVDSFVDQLSSEYGRLTVKRPENGKLQYLGMVFDFTKKGKVRVTMEKYVQDMLNEFEHIKGTSQVPASPNLFKLIDEELLDDEARTWLHSMTAKSLYLGKRVRPDILLCVQFLATRVTKATEGDMKKLRQLLRYIRGTAHKGIVLEPNKIINIEAYVDAAYGVHEDCKSHTGSVIGIGRGPIYASSTKQKIVTKSSFEAELVGFSDKSSQILWTRNFLIDLGYSVGAAKIYQDNMGTMAAIKNGAPKSERSRHIAIRYYFGKSKMESGELEVEYMPTEKMLADILTKPLQGAAFIKARDELLNDY